MASDWPFFAEMPPERAALQRQLVDGDPFLGLLGVRFQDAGADTATLAVTFRADLAQPTGILHGGLHSILIDTAIAQALLTTIRAGILRRDGAPRHELLRAGALGARRGQRDGRPQRQAHRARRGGRDR